MKKHVSLGKLDYVSRSNFSLHFHFVVFEAVDAVDTFFVFGKINKRIKIKLTNDDKSQ